jgi:nucleoside-diphosphate-sugar epimerase
MNIFITGGEGFIGRNLINYLMQYTNYTIYYCDNGNFSIPLFIDSENRLKKVCSDISYIKKNDLEGMDTLIHLAAVKKHNSSPYEEDDLLRTNIIETRRLFHLASRSSIKKIIFSSSLYASGNMHKLLFTEDELPVPSTLYGSSKFFGECCLRELVSDKKMSAIAFRLYFIYGPHQYYGKGYPSVFVNTLDALSNNKNPIIINDGKQLLDYLYVDDLASLILKSINTPSSRFMIYNASSSVAYEIGFIVNSLIDLWNKKFNTKFKAIYKGNDFTNGTYRSGSNCLARKSFDWSPQVSIEEGLRLIFNWYVSQLKR